MQIVNPYGLSEVGLVATGPNFVTLGEINTDVQIKVTLFKNICIRRQSSAKNYKIFKIDFH